MSGHRIKQYNGEEMTHERVVKLLRRDYPGVIFRTDFAAGIKMTIGQASKHKRLQYRRAFPDIFVYKPVARDTVLGSIQYAGLALELKAGDVKLKKRDTTWSSDHIKEQFDMLCELEAAGYACAFARGYDEASRVLQWYLEGGTIIKFEDFVPVRVDSELPSSDEEPF